MAVATVASLFWRFGPYRHTRKNTPHLHKAKHSDFSYHVREAQCNSRDKLWVEVGFSPELIDGQCGPKGFAFVCVLEAWRMSSWGWDSVVAAVISVLISHLNNGAKRIGKWSKLCAGCKEKVATYGHMNMIALWLMTIFSPVFPLREFGPRMAGNPFCSNRRNVFKPTRLPRFLPNKPCMKNSIHDTYTVYLIFQCVFYILLRFIVIWSLNCLPIATSGPTMSASSPHLFWSPRRWDVPARNVFYGFGTLFCHLTRPSQTHATEWNLTRFSQGESAIHTWILRLVVAVDMVVVMFVVVVVVVGGGGGGGGWWSWWWSWWWWVVQ